MFFYICLHKKCLFYFKEIFINNTIILDGNNLTIEDIYNIANKKFSVDFPKNKNFKEKIEKARKLLEDNIKKGYPIYGVTTGFGDSCNNQIGIKKTELLQESLVNFHGVGVGNFFSEIEGRAITAVRLNSNCKGFSAVRFELLDLMKNILNSNIIPCIPEIGSVGASGDLTPLSYLAAVLTGERKVYYKNEITDAKTAFSRENLSPLKLMAKEALALMNGTSVMTAIASLSWINLKKIADISDFITAATVEIINGNEVPFRDKVSLIKNHEGQIESARYIFNVLKSSKRVYKYEHLLDVIGTINERDYKKTDRKIQDRYSIRCAPQINGVLRDTLKFSKIWIENEINSANDNPLIDFDENSIYNSGNFYGGHISLACDYLRIALANTMDLSDKQSALIIDGKFNNLTENLIPKVDDNSELKGLLHGFKAAQIAISGICSEIHYLASPISIHSRPTEALNQDKVSLGTISARRLRDAIELAYLQLSIHILAVLQAIDIIGLTNFSDKTKNIYFEIRKFTKFVDKDRPLDSEINMVKEYLKDTQIFSLN